MTPKHIPDQKRLNSVKLAIVLIFVAAVCVGGWKWSQTIAARHAAAANMVEENSAKTDHGKSTASQNDGKGNGASSQLAPQTDSETSKLAPAGTYEPKDNIVDIDISEYAGYAGLIVANNGLEPTENSEFFKRGGFKVRLTRNEVERRSSLNAGKIAGLATTVDVLPIYGSQFQVVVPAQIGYSRGADGVVVRSEIKRINDLKGKILTTAQYTESDFFIRFLAEGAGLAVRMLPDVTACPDSNCVNLVYCKDTFCAGDLFVDDVKKGGKLIAGCVTWAPKTTEVVDALAGQAHILATSRNLLIVADILVVNKGFARNHPEYVNALVAGLLKGNQKVNKDPDSCLEVVGKAFGWDHQKAKAELASVHFANLPENQGFLSGWLDAGGCFSDIYQAAVRAYGRTETNIDGNQFIDQKAVTAADRCGEFKGEEVRIVPIHSDDSARPKFPLLSKDIRFLFKPNNFILELDDKTNQESLAAIKRMLQVSPGSTMLLRGHVDNGRMEGFRKSGGDAFVKMMAERARELSKNRALEIRRLLVERYDVEPARVDTVGLGWDEPSGTDNELNRRVEAQWFTYQ